MLRNPGPAPQPLTLALLGSLVSPSADRRVHANGCPLEKSARDEACAPSTFLSTEDLDRQVVQQLSFLPPKRPVLTLVEDLTDDELVSPKGAGPAFGRDIYPHDAYHRPIVSEPTYDTQQRHADFSAGFVQGYTRGYLQGYADHSAGLELDEDHFRETLDDEQNSREDWYDRQARREARDGVEERPSFLRSAFCCIVESISKI